MKPVYVIGHKNPDTDSICSAICYAKMKNVGFRRHFFIIYKHVLMQQKFLSFPEPHILNLAVNTTSTHRKTNSGGHRI